MCRKRTGRCHNRHFADAVQGKTAAATCFAKPARRKNPLNLIRCRYSAGKCDPSFPAASGHPMPVFKVVFVLAALAWSGTQTASAQANLGAQGGEGEPNRMQQWLVATPGMDLPS